MRAVVALEDFGHVVVLHGIDEEMQQPVQAFGQSGEALRQVLDERMVAFNVAGRIHAPMICASPQANHPHSCMDAWVSKM